MRRIFCAVLMFALSATAVLAQATTGASDDDRRGAIGVLPVGDPATLGPATIGPATIDDVDPPPAEAAITVALGGPAAASDVASVLGYIPCNPANCTLGQLNNGVAASFTQLSGQPGRHRLDAGFSGRGHPGELRDIAGVLDPDGESGAPRRNDADKRDIGLGQ